MRTTCQSLFLALALTMTLGQGARAQEPDDVAPLDGVIADMQVAGGRLSKLITDKSTQQKQQDAVDKLEALIKVLEQRRRQGGGQGGIPEMPAEESVIKSGPGGSGPLHDAKRNGRGWGQLPPHRREQILQSMTEGFPAHYQQLLERYYRRLAEEKPVSEAIEEAAPQKAPARPAAGASRPEAMKRDAAAAETK
jgi:hypothetical protein